MSHTWVVEYRKKDSNNDWEIFNYLFFTRKTARAYARAKNIINQLPNEYRVKKYVRVD